MPKTMARYPKIESIGSIRSIMLGILEVQVNPKPRMKPKSETHDTWTLRLHDPCIGLKSDRLGSHLRPATIEDPRAIVELQGHLGT